MGGIYDRHSSLFTPRTLLLCWSSLKSRLNAVVIADISTVCCSVCLSSSSNGPAQVTLPYISRTKPYPVYLPLPENINVPQCVIRSATSPRKDHQRQLLIRAVLSEAKNSRGRLSNLVELTSLFCCVSMTNTSAAQSTPRGAALSPLRT